MKKTARTINILLILLILVNCVVYRSIGGLLMKGVTSSGFALLGWINLIFMLRSGSRELRFPGWMVAALTLSVAADVVLNVKFIPGAALFALAHVLYFTAYCALEKFSPRDLKFVILVAVVSQSVVNSPWFTYDDPVMRGLAVVYALVISAMLGKALSNAYYRRDKVSLLLAAGSLLFWSSDLMLALEFFAGGGWLADTLCLFTYFPGQAILAHSLYPYGKQA